MNEQILKNEQQEEAMTITVTVPDFKGIVAQNNGGYYVTFKDGNNNLVTAPYDSTAVKNWIVANNEELMKENPKHLDTTVKAFANYIEAHHEEKTVVSRIAVSKGIIYYNFDGKNVMALIDGSDDCEAKIIPMEALTDKDIAFCNSPYAAPQVLPIPDDEIDLVDALQRLLHLNYVDAVALAVTIVTMFAPCIRKPILYIDSDRDDVKQAFNFALQSLIDPLKEDSLYLPSFADMDDDQACSERYFQCGHTVKDLKNIEACTELAVLEDYYYLSNDLSNAYSISCIEHDDLGVGFADMLLSVNPNLGFDHTTNVLEDVKAELNAIKPYLLDKIFEVLRKALYIKETVGSSEDYGELAEYIHLGRAISKVLFGDDRTFLKAYALKKGVKGDNVMSTIPSRVIVSGQSSRANVA